jgi:organic hydroperoxide reductase OsmC/OhrA
LNEKTDSGIKHKALVFKCAAKWTGGRTWVNTSEDVPDIPGGPPVDFGGEPGRWTPEDLMVASVNSCTVSTFITLCLRNNFKFLSLESSIEGVLEHDGKGYKFARMIIRPRVQVKLQADVATAIEYLHKAHKICFMGNSVTAQISLEPEVTVADA